MALSARPGYQHCQRSRLRRLSWNYPRTRPALLSGIVALSAVVGALCGAFLSDKAKPFRRILWIALGVILLLLAVIFSWTASDILAFIIGFVIAYKLLAVVKEAAAAAERRARDITLGSAEWATLAHLQERNLIGDDGFFLGLFEDSEARLRYSGDRHLLTIAPTRSGKGTSAIVPNLLTYQGSAWVIDPKGENARMTAPRRGSGDSVAGIPGMQQQVYTVDPWGITGQPIARFNPIDWIIRDEANSSENATTPANSIVTPREGKADPFWDEEAKALLMGFILFVAFRSGRGWQAASWRSAGYHCRRLRAAQ